ncbi:hypothetical protein QC763_603605 [Podospora pseudopauciseta]|uniref:Uncharacterized protein n=1 Tax=Podospora pseudopauciseta TaxID=2093780 RepID=A0ABR0H3Z2_9PEZI|nr:hypothetical protein QC763_603605 [Podospora pseudopauciseta]
MKFTTLTTLTTLATTAKADIWIYECTDLGSGDVKNTRLILQKWDVSKIEGVVCDGDGCYNGNPEDLERLEYDVDFGHFTIYKNRDWNLVGFEKMRFGATVARRRRMSMIARRSIFLPGS